MARLKVRIAALSGAVTLVLSGMVVLAPTASAVCDEVEVSSAAGTFCAEASITGTKVAAEGTTEVTSNVDGVVLVMSDIGQSIVLNPADNQGIIQGHTHVTIQAKDSN